MMNNGGLPHSIIGKIVGGAIGLCLMGPFGLVVGVLLGHLYDRHVEQAIPTQSPQQEVFVKHLFGVLGFLAKADGQVSQAEINYTSHVMRQLRLSAAQRQRAMQAFYGGKREGFDWVAAVQAVRQISVRHKRWLHIFMNAQVQMAYADGVIKELLKPILQRMTTILGLPPINFAYYDAVFGWQDFYQRAWQQYQHQGGGYEGSSYQPPRQSSMSLQEAYSFLGMNEKMTEAEMKKVYRKMMSKYHPDKLMSKGLSEKEMQEATEKVQKIQAAYELIRRDRKF